ncbi:TetR family transcriptional regulator C-terminal domain-containing protein, partial [Alcanivorax sp. HI0033]
TGENERLHQRIQQFYDRVESQLKQVLREAEIKEGRRTRATPTITANLLLAVVEGRIAQFVRSGFKARPSQDWQTQWELLVPTLFRDQD